MFVEVSLVLYMLCSCGVIALALGLRPWARSAVVVWGSIGALASLPGLVLCWALYNSGLALVLTSSSAVSLGLAAFPTVVTGVGFTHAWQYSLIIACLAPCLFFSFLLLTRQLYVVVGGVASLGILIGVGLAFVLSTSLFVWLVAFELLLLVSLYLLRLTSKSERIGEAVAEMFFWTLAGSVCLLLGFVTLASVGLTSLDAISTVGGFPTFVGLLFLAGFGVKLPLWPCFSWLLKAHVEASVEFSILLSGLVVKFGAMGLYRTLLFQATPVCGYVLIACSTLAVLEAVIRLTAQRDLKRIVALTTVIELNWAGVCIGLGGSVFDQVGALVLVAHSFTTTAEFFTVECVYRRYGTRDVAAVSGVAYSLPVLFYFLFVTTLTTIGFPASSLFAAKLFFLTALAQLSLTLCVFYAFIFVLVLPIIFLRIWVPVWFGQPQVGVLFFDLNGREFSILVVTVSASLLFGLCPSIAVEAV